MDLVVTGPGNVVGYEGCHFLLHPFALFITSDDRFFMGFREPRPAEFVHLTFRFIAPIPFRGFRMVANVNIACIWFLAYHISLTDIQK